MKYLITLFLFIAFAADTEAKDLAAIEYKIDNPDSSFTRETGRDYAKLIAISANVTKGLNIYNPFQLEKDISGMGIYPERNLAGQQVTWMMEAVKTFSNCPFGIECFVQRPGLLETLVLFIDSPDMRIKQNILHILTAIAYTNPNDGPYRILSALSALQKALHEEDRFDCLLKMLENSCKIARKSPDKSKIDLNLKFVSDCLIFFNVLLEDIADFNLRVSVRCQILRDPFKREFEVGLENILCILFIHFRGWKVLGLPIKSPCSKPVLRLTKAFSMICCKVPA